MINKYTLKFISNEEENNYVLSQQAIMLYQLRNFSIYVMCFTIVTLIELATSNRLLYFIICCIIAFLNVVVYQWMKKSPHYINYILIVYQIIGILVFKINNFISNDQQVSNRYSWYQGFQASLFHYCIILYYLDVYLQGTNFMQQSLMIVLVFAAHIYGLPLEDIEGIMNLIKFLFIFISMLNIKYTILKLSKSEFIQNQQQKVFAAILQDHVPSQALLIEFDKSIDQLTTVWCNRHLSNTFKLSDSIAMRAFLRKLRTTSQITIEHIVRQFILSHQTNTIIEEQVIYNQKEYVVRLTQCSGYQKQYCLVIIKQLGKSSTRAFQQFILSQFAHLMNSFLKVSQIKSLQTNRLNVQVHFNQIRNAYSLLNFNTSRKIRVSYAIFRQKLITILHQDSFRLVYDLDSFSCDIQSTFQIMINIFHIILIVNRNRLPYLNITVIGTSLVTIKISCCMEPELQQSVVNYFKGQVLDQHHTLAGLLQQAYLNAQQFDMPSQIAVLIAMNQYILSNIAPYNYIVLYQQINMIEFIFKLYQ